MKVKVYIENKLITIKKLENGSYVFDGNFYFIYFLIIFILIFPIAFLITNDLKISFISTLILYGLSIIFFYINDYFGKKMHSKIFQKQIFQNLMLKGFKKEKIGNYEGLTIEKDGRTIRIFYDWNKYAGGFLSFGDIVIDIFFEPQVLDGEISKLDNEKVKKLTKTYDKSFWLKNNRIIFTFCEIKFYHNYYPWSSSKKIESKIDFGFKILEENNLKPFSIRKIDNPEYQIYKEQFSFYPKMQFIWEYLEEIENK